jgi:hypothetical protein
LEEKQESQTTPRDTRDDELVQSQLENRCFSHQDKPNAVISELNNSPQEEKTVIDESHIKMQS